MREYTHIAGAILFFLVFAYLLNFDNIIYGIVFAGWISVFPDVLDKLIGKHKGIGHSIFWVFPLVLAAFFNFFIGIALIIGFLSHLFFDIFTKNGCPILYPITRTTFVSLTRFNRIKTLSNQEKGVFIFLIFLIVPLFIFTTGTSLNFISGYPNNGANTGNSDGNSVNQSGNALGSSNTFHINVYINPYGNKNVSVEKVNENVTNVLVKDIEQGG